MAVIKGVSARPQAEPSTMMEADPRWGRWLDEREVLWGRERRHEPSCGGDREEGGKASGSAGFIVTSLLPLLFHIINRTEYVLVLFFLNCLILDRMWLFFILFCIHYRLQNKNCVWYAIRIWSIARVPLESTIFVMKKTYIYMKENYVVPYKSNRIFITFPNSLLLLRGN